MFVVDDDPAVRLSTVELLKSAGFQAKSFSSAEEFLTAFESGQVGCLLLDVRLLGMSGIELQKKMASESIPLPVILISGHATNELQEQGRANGAKGLLEKPIESSQLIEVVRSAIRDVTDAVQG